jgi:uncharacterized protein (TIGR02118 family)
MGMAKVLVIYNPPTDPKAFDDYYAMVHTPIAKKIPGLRSLEISRGAVVNPTGPAPYHQIAILTFDDMAALQAGIGSAEGQAAVADMANFANGGASVLMFDYSVA